MLYDPKWEKPTVAGLIAWLETQPAEGEYYYLNCSGECLFGQYMTSLGIDWSGLHCRQSPYIDTLHSMGGLRVQKIASEGPWTFGAALNRARALAATA